MGTLYLVSTPIGNLEDVSPRAIRLLRDADAVLAEDTRRTGALLHHLDISTPLISLHAHNEAARKREVLARLGKSEALVLVSDAGTPLVSDPGDRLIPAVLEAGHEVVPIPGPSAVLHALVGSGLPVTPFVFVGFPPRKGRERTRWLERVAESRETVVLFESPERTGDLLGDLSRQCGEDRRAVVARELTKLHEEFRRGSLGDLAKAYRARAPRGEVTIVVAPLEGDNADVDVDTEAVGALARALLARGHSRSQAAREVARRLNLPRNRVYDIVQDLPEAGVEHQDPRDGLPDD